ncbi:CCA tRNA nucleotidyltransferase [Bauldia sp.]|uniref:CCA tRNA nucleotidyltransferase n=1 Tax=Bauldia sp. TaxID=2575872 RepID=UPI003BA9EB98
MAEALPNLANRDWFQAKAVRTVFEILDADGPPSRIVGGAVRDALAGVPVGDVDFATPLSPDSVIEQAGKSSLKIVPTGVSHGTVTVVAEGIGFQVTTLREDIETDGRHAVVRFGDDWTADARRRDFTVNALSVDATGHVHDPLGGLPDIEARLIRFIGDPDQRIAEDHLRLLRFFRFNATFASGPLDPAGLSAAIRARHSLRDLSAERIGEEMRRLVLGGRAAEIAGIMQDAGVLGVVLGGVGYIGPLQRLAAFAPQSGAALRLAALGCRVQDDVERLADRLRLSNAESERMDSALVNARKIAVPMTEHAAKRMLYRCGADAWRDAVALGFAWAAGGDNDEAWQMLLSLPDRWAVPAFPLTGADVRKLGVATGPAVGSLLRSIESWWIESDFQPDEDALRRRLQQMVSVAQ